MVLAFPNKSKAEALETFIMNFAFERLSDLQRPDHHEHLYTEAFSRDEKREQLSSESETESVGDSPQREMAARPKSNRKKKRKPHTNSKSKAKHNTKSSTKPSSKAMVAVTEEAGESPKSSRKQQEEEEVVTVAQMQRMEPVFQREIGALEDVHR